jgi:acyl-CoA oxidase
VGTGYLVFRTTYSPRDFLGRTDQYIRAAAIINRLDELRRMYSWSEEEYSTASWLLSEVMSITLHDAGMQAYVRQADRTLIICVAFQPVFLGQGSPALMEKYWDLVYEKGIQGYVGFRSFSPELYSLGSFRCYLQTELGHGTNVARLETTSTYIPETQEFEINSPSLTSTKWWIGALGKSATHGVVQAKLILPNGKDMGPHLFFVQLRSLGLPMCYPVYSDNECVCRGSQTPPRNHCWRHWSKGLGR